MTQNDGQSSPLALAESPQDTGVLWKNAAAIRHAKEAQLSLKYSRKF